MCILPKSGAKKQPYETNHRNLVRSICTRIENVINFHDFYKALILKGIWNENIAEFGYNRLLGCSWVVRHPRALIDWLDRSELCQKM